jgi:hypothetical protein
VDSTFRDALLWSALPAAVLVGVGTAALLRPSLRRLTDGARKFSAGALFAVIAIELMPDLLFSHQFAAMAAFALGVGLLIGVRWLTGRFGRADGLRKVDTLLAHLADCSNKSLPYLLCRKPPVKNIPYVPVRTNSGPKYRRCWIPGEAFFSCFRLPDDPDSSGSRSHNGSNKVCCRL